MLLVLSGWPVGSRAGDGLTLSLSVGHCSGMTTTKAYLKRKEAEGKTRMEAMCCLKRHLARRYYRLLSDRSRHRIEHQVYPGVP